jgi:hypothetical protein
MNRVTNADSTGEIILQTFSTDPFRDEINLWNADDLKIITGGDSSMILIYLDTVEKVISLNSAINNKVLKMSLKWPKSLHLIPSKNTRLISITTNKLMLSKQEKDDPLPDKIFELLELNKIDFRKYLDLKSKVYLEVHKNNPHSNWADFVNYKIDTVTNKLWKVSVEDNKIVIHEKKFISQKSPGPVSFLKVYNPLDIAKQTLTIDSNNLPTLRLSGNYKDAIPIDIVFTSEYETACIVKEVLRNKDFSSELIVKFFRKDDLETEYIKKWEKIDASCIMKNNISGIWSIDTRKVFTESQCGDIKYGIINNIDNLF